MDLIKWSLNMDSMIRVDPTSTAGGLALFWKGSTSVSLEKLCDWFIDVHIFDTFSNKSWRLINVYFSSDNAVREFVDKCGLTDLGFLGHPFAWRNNRTVGLDYYALKLDLSPNLPKFRAPFQFDARWANDEEAHEVTQHAWSTQVHGSRFFLVFKKVQSCRVALTNWKWRKRGDESRTMENIKSKIFALSNGSHNPPFSEIQKLKWQLQQFWDKEEMFRRQNRISGIEKADGVWTHNPLEMHDEFCNYFSGIFEASSLTKH
ncbi:hypothetical protein Vadar_004613 [Vaccinium darrowii]|uniref:Uncharacterized protein n=1 Tax=Vaccinium darrowii TaxID=229202 RepID=A0ACB7Z2D2_9ERIC|nr:hypothetical protein Vadar_004613 [Vaccinium darrowii]